MCAVGHGPVGPLWFAIFLQLILIVGVLHTLASDAIAMHRFQIAVFGAVAIVFAVDGVDRGIYSSTGSLQAMAAGWLILAIVDILWVLYFTSEEDSLQLHIFNSMGTGGLTPPNRRRRAGRGQSLHMGGNGYGGAYGGGGIGPGDLPYDTKLNAPPLGGAMSARSQGSINAGGDGSIGNIRSMSGVGGGGVGGGGGSITGVPTQLGAENLGASSPLMGSGNAGVGAGGGLASPERSNTSDITPGGDPSGLTYKAKALYACEFLTLPLLNCVITVPVSADSGYPISRHCIIGRPERNFVQQRRSSGHCRQARQVVASEKSRRYGRK